MLRRTLPAGPPRGEETLNPLEALPCLDFFPPPLHTPPHWTRKPGKNEKGCVCERRHSRLMQEFPLQKAYNLPKLRVQKVVGVW